MKMFSGDREEKENMETMRNEFSLLSGLQHPHLVEVYDFDFDSEGSPFFTRGYVEGKNVFNYMESMNFRKHKGKWDKGISLFYHILIQVGEALAAIHSRGLVHGDLKPANILVMEKGRKGKLDPRVKLLDFGLSHWETTTSPKFLSGTMEYLAPEYFLGEPLQ